MGGAGTCWSVGEFCGEDLNPNELDLRRKKLDLGESICASGLPFLLSEVSLICDEGDFVLVRLSPVGSISISAFKCLRSGLSLTIDSFSDFGDIFGVVLTLLDPVGVAVSTTKSIRFVDDPNATVVRDSLLTGEALTGVASPSEVFIACVLRDSFFASLSRGDSNLMDLARFISDDKGLNDCLGVEDFSTGFLGTVNGRDRFNFSLAFAFIDIAASFTRFVVAVDWEPAGPSAL